MNYDRWLHDALSSAAKQEGFPELVFSVFEERDFENDTKKDVYSANDVKVVVKRLLSTISYDVISTPIQIMAWSESGSMSKCLDCMRAFAQANNYLTQTESSGGKTIMFKHVYSDPVVAEAFQEMGADVRSQIIISASLVEIDGVADISYNGTHQAICIDSNTMKPLSLALACHVTPDTESVANANLTQSVMERATTSMTLAIPAIDGPLVNAALQVMSGSAGTDSSHSVAFSIGSVAFALSMRITTVSYNTSPEGAPAIVIGFIV